MTHEIIQTGTAALDGNPAEATFQTVAFDRGIPLELRTALEHPPTFRQLHPPDHPKAPPNPVAFSYRNIILDNEEWHVLSQVLDVGIDQDVAVPYLLAHQIAFRADEAPLEGPAWLLTRPGFLFRHWPGAGSVLEFPRGRPLPRLPQTIRERQNRAGMIRLSHWKKTTGDPGWAGVLAETLRNDRPAVLIYPPGMELLPLFAEALSILPPEERWKATFTTFAVADNSHSEADATALPVHWFGAIRGTPEAKRLATIPGILLLDLTQPLGTPPEDELVLVARAGEIAPPRIDRFNTETESNPVDSELEEPPTVTHLSMATKLPTDEELAAPPPVSPPAPVIAIEPEPVAETVPPVIPAIIVPTSLEPAGRSRRASRKKGVFDSVLRTESRSLFYTVYGIAFGLLLMLIILLFDMRMHWGIIDSIRDAFTGPSEEVVEKKPTPPAPVKTPAEDTKKPLPKQTPAKQDTETRPTGSAPVDTSAETQASGGKPAGPDLAQMAEARKKQEEELAAEQERLRGEFQRLRKEQRAALTTALEECELPPAVALRVPLLTDAPEGDDLVIEKPTPMTVRQLAPLFPVGHALQLDIDSLLACEGTEYVCREVELGTPIEGTDAVSLRWTINVRDKETGVEQALCLLILEEGGLTFDWLPESLAQRNYLEAGRIPFSFLTLAVAPAEDEEITEPAGPENQAVSSPLPTLPPRRLPLFVPVRAEPFTVSQLQEKPEITQSTFFSNEPWNAVFSEQFPESQLLLTASIVPTSAKGLAGMTRRDDSTPQLLQLILQSDTIHDAKRVERLGWRISLGLAMIENRCMIQLQNEQERQLILLNDSLKEMELRRNEEAQILDREQRAAFNASGEKQRQLLDEVEKKRKAFDAGKAAHNETHRKINDLIEKLPQVRESILTAPDLKSLRLEYALWLIRKEIKSNAPNRMLLMATGDAEIKE